ncbi:Peroxisomal 2,4-dienoyl-CoA reductase [Lamellibrachia satsuma]|nr:Peroxisomal 2,4-dienoyl-CoA reductase [Lamellibrachia satsuma]
MSIPKIDACLKAYTHLFRPDLLRGMVAFITGGGSGIGFTIAEILMRHECDTVIASRNFARLRAASEQLESATGRKCLPIEMDVRSPDDVTNAVEMAMDQFKRVNILVNNAAGNFLAPLAAMSSNAYRTILDIDTVGTFNTSTAVYKQFLKDNGGVIVNISATLGYRGQVLQAHSGTAKAAVDALTRHMAVEWGPDHVRVVGVSPGPIAETEGNTRLGGECLMDHHIPLGRVGTKVEVANIVLFVASEAGSLISGETIVADGGAWMTMPNGMKEITDMMKNKGC